MSTPLHWWEDEAELEKLASSGHSMPFIEAVIKEAARQKEKQDVHADFEAAGRIMAHGYYDELLKLAASHCTTEPVDFPKTDGKSTEPVPFQPHHDVKDKSALEDNEKKLKAKKYAMLKSLSRR